MQKAGDIVVYESKKIEEKLKSLSEGGTCFSKIRLSGKFSAVNRKHRTLLVSSKNLCVIQITLSQTYQLKESDEKKNKTIILLNRILLRQNQQMKIDCLKKR